MRNSVVVAVAGVWFILGVMVGQASASRSGPVNPAPTGTASAASLGVGSPGLVQTEAPSERPTALPAAAMTPAPRPSPTVPAATPRASTATVSGSDTTAASVSGQSSWYCLAGRSACTRSYAGGLYAAAGPALRKMLGPGWRGTVVRVCAASRCVRVRLIDWCQCYGSRVIDLYADAFARLAHLSRGVIAVVIR